MMALQPFRDGLAVATLWQEARGCSYTEQCLVAQVIKNRMALDYESDGTLLGTILKPYQFSGWLNPTIIARSLDAVSESQNNVDQLWMAWEKGFILEPHLVAYYSPASMQPAGSVPTWARGITPAKTTPNFCFFTIEQMR